MGLLSGLKEKLAGQSAAPKAVVTEAMVKDALSAVIDPDLHKDIVTLGFVRAIKIDGGTVALEVNLTTPACPVKEKLKTECETALLALPGITAANVVMTATTRAAPQAATSHPALA